MALTTTPDGDLLVGYRISQGTQILIERINVTNGVAKTLVKDLSYSGVMYLDILGDISMYSLHPS